MAKKYAEALFAPKITTYAQAIAEGFDSASTSALGVAIGSKAIFNSVRKITSGEGGWTRLAISAASTAYMGHTLMSEIVTLRQDMLHAAQAQTVIDQERQPAR